MNIEADFNYRKPLKENEAKPAYGLEEPNEDTNVLPEYLKAFKKGSRVDPKLVVKSLWPNLCPPFLSPDSA